MKKILNIVIIILLLIELNACNMNFKREDFIGIWKSGDGSVIEFKKDGSYIAKQINYGNFYSKEKFKRKIFDITGNWEINNNSKQGNILNLTSNATFDDYGINDTYTINGVVRSHKIGLSFKISGEGFFESSPPYYLFVWIGDPDDANKYKFVKE